MVSFHNEKSKCSGVALASAWRLGSDARLWLDYSSSAQSCPNLHLCQTVCRSWHRTLNWLGTFIERCVFRHSGPSSDLEHSVAGWNRHVLATNQIQSHGIDQGIFCQRHEKNGVRWIGDCTRIISKKEDMIPERNQTQKIHKKDARHRAKNRHGKINRQKEPHGKISTHKKTPHKRGRGGLRYCDTACLLPAATFVWLLSNVAVPNVSSKLFVPNISFKCCSP